MKKGQITLFIILGIVIVVLLALFFSFIRHPVVETLETTEVESYIAACIDQAAIDGLLIIGLKGGYIDVLPTLVVGNTSLWKTETSIVRPSIADIENNLESYIDYYLPGCLDFSSFSGYNITVSNPETSVTLGRTVLVNTYMNTVIKQKNAEKIRESYEVNYDIGFQNLYNLSDRILNGETVGGVESRDYETYRIHRIKGPKIGSQRFSLVFAEIAGCPTVSELHYVCRDLTDGIVRGIKKMESNETCVRYACEDNPHENPPDWNDIEWWTCSYTDKITLEIAGYDAANRLEVGVKIGETEYTIDINSAGSIDHLEASCTS